MKRACLYNEEEGVYVLGVAEDAWKIIYNFLQKHNYTIYHVREWEEDGRHWYDVGSHSEFFFTEEI